MGFLRAPKMEMPTPIAPPPPNPPPVLQPASAKPAKKSSLPTFLGAVAASDISMGGTSMSDTNRGKTLLGQ